MCERAENFGLLARVAWRYIDDVLNEPIRMRFPYGGAIEVDSSTAVFREETWSLEKVRALDYSILIPRGFNEARVLVFRNKDG